MENNINFIDFRNFMQFDSAAGANHQPYETGLSCWEYWCNYQFMWYPPYQNTARDGITYQGPWVATDLPRSTDQAYAIQPSLDLKA